MIAATSIWPDGSFNGVEVVWLAIVCAAAVFTAYALRRAEQQRIDGHYAECEHVVPLRLTAAQQRAARLSSELDSLTPDAFAWPKE